MNKIFVSIIGLVLFSTSFAFSADIPKEVKTLIIEDITKGSGKVAVKKSKIKVHYTGWIFDAKKADGKGKQFDSSRGGQPFSFTLGEGQVIKGWDEGFKDMKVGGKRKLFIPADKAYGDKGAGDGLISPGDNLYFEVELLEVI